MGWGRIGNLELDKLFNKQKKSEDVKQAVFMSLQFRREIWAGVAKVVVW